MSDQSIAIEKFAAVKRRLDAAQGRVSMLAGKLEGAREHYNSIMVELKRFGVGSLEELNDKIAKLETTVISELTGSENTLTALEEAERAFNIEEASIASDG